MLDPQTLIPTSEFVDDRELAIWLQISRETIKQWRRKRTGPPVTRFGRTVRYHVPTVRTWLDSQTQRD